MSNPCGMLRAAGAAQDLVQKGGAAGKIILVSPRYE